MNRTTMENNFDVLKTVPQPVFHRLVATAQDNSNLLSYNVGTTPAPLQASPADGDLTTAALTIVVSAGSDQTIYCNEIRILFDIGELAQNFTNVGTGILAAVSPSDQWQIAQIDEGIFSVTPKKPMYNKISTAGLVIQIYNVKVNREVGTFALTVQENSSTDGATFTRHTDIYSLSKFPYGFFVSDFTTSIAQVDDGTPVLLTWHGSANATYAILYGSEVVDVSLLRRWTSPPLHNDTTFLLRVSPMIEGGSELITTYLQTTVNVRDPDVSAAVVAVKQQMSVGHNPALNAVTIYGTQTNNNELFVKGPTAQVIQFYEETTVNGEATVQSLQVGGTFLGIQLRGTVQTNGDLTVDSDVQVSGNSNIGTLVVKGDLTAGGRVYSRGTGLMCAQAQLSGGRADVPFAPHQQAAVAGRSYTVLVMPSEACNGLCVVQKNASGFVVEELNNGTSTITFDWFVAPGDRQ